MDIHRDNFGDLISVDSSGSGVQLQSCDEAGRWLGHDASLLPEKSDFLFTPKAARKLAKSLKRAARAAEAERG